MTIRPSSSRAGSALSAGASDAADALRARLGLVRREVALLVEQRSANDPTAHDPLRGLYISDVAARHLVRPDVSGLSSAGGQAGVLEGVLLQATEAVGGDRLARLVDRHGLTDLDAALLLIALAPDVDRSFEPLYGYLNDDISRRRASIGLALDLCALSVDLSWARARFHPSAPLFKFGLISVEDLERPFLSRTLRVPDRLAAHLLGDDVPDSALAEHMRPLEAEPVRCDAEFIGSLAHRLTSDAARSLAVYLREHREGEGLAVAAAALRAAGMDALHVAAHGDGGDVPLPELLREARLSDCVLVVSQMPDEPRWVMRPLTTADVTVLFVGGRPYDPRWCDCDPLVLDAPRLPAGAVAAWSAALGETSGFDLAATVAPYRLGGDRIARAARAARELAAFDGTPTTAAHLRLAARQQSASGLERHARRIRPDVSWEDLVLPAQPLAQLNEFTLRARHRERVLGDWRLSAGGGRGRGVLGLFAGQSGTGKTLSAEVVAADLGLDLYVIQLSSIVDKYVGETEKNLERIFTEADQTDAVLLFDEADAVFGKRSEVKDSHDRYANMESAYLLQRLESFNGIALLTTNLRANIDEAFTRRLDMVIDFPFPDAEQRLALWRHSLVRVPCAEDTDPSACAQDFELAGGSIRSAVVTAAYAAAGRGGPVTTSDLLEGARREYRKAGRLVPGEGGW
ncbi:ATP-binding protein [Streptomyces sp. NPDC059193]|uniref:ATP-binding protein n=1 Tax=Streptomyces sp. NPDC059193 TaxID=3346763 RepID=UPI0036B43A30